MRPRRIQLLALSLMIGPLITLTLSACTGQPPTGRPATGRQEPQARWVQFRHLAGVVDLAGPLPDGVFVVAAAGRLFLLARNHSLTPFARGAHGYSTATGTEPYLALARHVAVQGTGCSFPPDTVFALDPASRPRIIAIDRDGQARPFASLPAGVSLSGIAFDGVGRFGYRLLVTAGSHGRTTVFGIGCDATVNTITSGAPPMEGGMAVAPVTFGHFGGDLIAPSETSGRVFAVTPGGQVVTLVRSGLPRGGDIGVESAGFVPAGVAASSAAYLADRFSAGNKHPGDDAILRLPGAELMRAGVKPGDLLVATEGGAKTIAVSCTRSCAVSDIANGPAIAHGEGHIAFAP